MINGMKWETMVGVEEKESRKEAPSEEKSLVYLEFSEADIGSIEVREEIRPPEMERPAGGDLFEGVKSEQKPAEMEERLGDLSGEMEALRKELKEALSESPDGTVEGELEEFTRVQLSTEDQQTFGEGDLKEEGLREFHEEIFKEGELEKLAEEAMRANEKSIGESMREGEETGVKTSPERLMQEVLSGAIKELVRGFSTKIFTQLMDAVAAAAVERIEKMVQKVVPELAEEAIKKEIWRVEKRALTQGKSPNSKKN